jgi:hypothetical protein
LCSASARLHPLSFARTLIRGNLRPLATSVHE